jgi:hypothetical protein
VKHALFFDFHTLNLKGDRLSGSNCLYPRGIEPPSGRCRFLPQSCRIIPMECRLDRLPNQALKRIGTSKRAASIVDAGSVSNR